MGEVTIVESRELARADPGAALDRVRSFFDPVSLGDACIASDWTVAKEVEILVRMAEVDPDPKVRLGAMDALRKRKLESLRLSGQLAEITATKEGTDSEGRAARVTATTTAIMGRGRMRTEELLRAVARGVDLGKLEVEDGGGTGEVGPEKGGELGPGDGRGVEEAGVQDENAEGPGGVQGDSVDEPERVRPGQAICGGGQEIGGRHLLGEVGEGVVDAEWDSVERPEDDGDHHSVDEFFCPGRGVDEPAP